MNNLSLTLNAVIGSDLDDAVRNGCDIALRLRLAYVDFEANDMTYTCYPDGTAQRFIKHVSGRDEWDGEKWTHIKPVSQR
jgi:hypothetical protein